MNDNLSLTLDQWREQLAQDPNVSFIIQDAAEDLLEDGLPVELMEELIRTLATALQAPEMYPQVREEMISSGVADEEDMPPAFDEKYIMLMLCSLDLVRDTLLQQGPTAPQQFARGGLAQAGRNGDTMLAHINPIEARMLLRNMGSGTINPETGLPEFGLFKKIKKIFKKIAKPILTIASIVPGPWQVPALAVNAAYSASQGNWLGAALSAFGAYAAPGGFGGFGEAGGTGISGGLDLSKAFGSLSDAGANLVGAAGDAASGMAGIGTSAAGAASGASAGAAGLGSSLGAGVSGSIASAGGLGGLGIEGLAAPAMESIGGLGEGVSGSLADLGEAPGLLPQLHPDTMDTLNSASKLAKTGMNLYRGYQALNPPEPQQFSQQNAQRQMQQMGGLGMNTNRAFGLGGNQFRNPGMMARVGFRRGGLARCACKGN